MTTDHDEEQEDKEYDDALRLVGPTVVEVQSPHPEIVKKLKDSPEFRRICEELQKSHSGSNRYKSAEFFLLWAVPVSLDPPLEELLSATERRAISKKIRRNAEGLKAALSEFKHADGTPAYPLQPILSRLSVHKTATDYLRWKGYEQGDHQAIVDRMRFSIYRLVAYEFDDILDSLIYAGEILESMNAKIHRPKKQSARRLYFLRSMTARLHSEYKSPFRKLTLALASLFFDCSDLDEATVSKLAPVKH